MASVQVLYGQNIFDLANKVGYTIDYVIKLILENPFITSLDYDLDANPGQTIQYDDTFRVNSPQILTQKAKATQSNTRTKRGVTNQSSFDVSLETTGIENLVALLIENNFTNIDTGDLEGALFNFKLSDVKDLGFYNSLNNSGLRISTNQIITQPPIAPGNFLLQEDGTGLLQEDGTGIILE